jgi:hypothetical protein
VRPRRAPPGSGLFGHAAAEFVDVMFFVVLGALFTAITQTIVPRRDLTTLSGTRVASVLTLMPVATLLSISNGVGRPGSGGACAWRARSCMTTASNDASSRCSGTPIVHCVADARPVVLLVIAPEDTTPPADSWVQVEGVLSSRNYRGGRLITTTADRILPAAEPQEPDLRAGF